MISSLGILARRVILTYLQNRSASLSPDYWHHASYTVPKDKKEMFYDFYALINMEYRPVQDKIDSWKHKIVNAMFDSLYESLEYICYARLMGLLWDIRRAEAGIYEDFSGLRDYQGDIPKEPYEADLYTQGLFNAAYGHVFNPKDKRPSLNSVISIKRCKDIVPPIMLKFALLEVSKKFNEISTKHLHKEYENYKKERGENPGQGKVFLQGVVDWYEKKTLEHGKPRLNKPDPDDIKGLLSTWMVVADVFDKGAQAQSVKDKITFVDLTVSLQHNKGHIFDHFLDKSWKSLNNEDFNRVKNLRSIRQLLDFVSSDLKEIIEDTQSMK